MALTNPALALQGGGPFGVFSQNRSTASLVSRSSALGPSRPANQASLRPPEDDGLVVELGAANDQARSDPASAIIALARRMVASSGLALPDRFDGQPPQAQVLPRAGRLLSLFPTGAGGAFPLGRNAGGLVISALQDWKASLDQLAGLDADQAKRLGVLLDLLMELNPDGAGDVASRFARFVDRLVALHDKLQGISAQPSGGAQPPPAATPSQNVSIQISIEVKVTVRVEEIVARLQDNGVTVQRTELEASQTIRLDIAIGSQPAQRSDPLALDLDGNGIELSSAANGQRFDVDGDGNAEKTAFVRGADAFLALDANGNGRIDSGRELFGDQEGHANGFAKLSGYDQNRDGIIDRQDPVFDQLRLLRDLNGDGTVAPNETTSLSAAGLKSLCLAYESARAMDDKGNTASEVSSFERNDGSRGLLVDVNVGYRAA